MPVVAPFSGHLLLIFLLQVSLLLGTALLLGRLAVRWRMPAIVGELTAGVLLGPSVLAHFAPGVTEWLLPQRAEQMNLLDAAGQLGVLLLVAVTGTHMDLGLIRAHGRSATAVSLTGLVIPLGLGVGAGFLLPTSLIQAQHSRTVFALFLGIALCVSAIPVIAKTLMDMRLIDHRIGQLILMAGTIDDAVGWLLLSVVSAVAAGGLYFAGVAWSILSLLFFLVFMATAGHHLVRAAMRLALRSGDRAVPVATAVVLVLLCSAATHALGLEAVFGAFSCGILLGTCRDLRPDWVDPLRTVVLSVLAPLFFAAVGLRVDLRALFHPVVAGAGVLIVALAVTGKFLGAGLGAALTGMNRWEAVALGAGMNARGVVEIIIASVGLRAGILNTETYTIIVLLAVLTSVMAPPILRLAMRRVDRSFGDTAIGPAPLTGRRSST
ncbi:cation:proton antiporter [Allokutzneria albata]|nr:cation:proton antiporter [Allokutzneria albata]